MDGKKRGVLQRSREEGPREKEEPEQSTWDRTKLAWFKGPKDASMAGAAPGRKRETRGEIREIDWARPQRRALEDYSTIHSPCPLWASTIIHFGLSGTVLITTTVGPLYQQLVKSVDAELAVWKADCSMPFNIRDLSILRFGYPLGFWNQSPSDSERLYYFLIPTDSIFTG